MKTLVEMKTAFGEYQTRREELKAKASMTDAENTEYLDIIAKQTKLVEDIKRSEAEAAIDAVARTPQPLPAGVVVNGPVAEASAYSLGEYMQDIFKAATGREHTARFDNLQKKFKAAATGLSEGVPSDGGFLVGTDMMSGLIEKVYEDAQLAARASKSAISTGSNAITINGISESSRADGSRFGGVLGYWEGEADAITPTKPKFFQVNLKLNKVTAAYYASDEVLADAPFMQAQVNRMVSQEFAFKLDDALVRGTGAGQPLGFLNAPALVTVTKETGQSADTINFDNVMKMYSRMPAYNRRNAIWVVNDECLPQLMTMSMAIGTAGIPVWLPANPAVNQPFDTLLGKPIVYAEQAAALGDAGDISFVDFSQYQLIDKGGIQGASSIHVKFLESEQVFRFVYRVDGQPLWKSALTQYKGAATQSPLITLGAR